MFTKLETRIPDYRIVHIGQRVAVEFSVDLKTEMDRDRCLSALAARRRCSLMIYGLVGNGTLAASAHFSDRLPQVRICFHDGVLRAFSPLSYHIPTHALC